MLSINGYLRLWNQKRCFVSPFKQKSCVRNSFWLWANSSKRFCCCQARKLSHDYFLLSISGLVSSSVQAHTHTHAYEYIHVLVRFCVNVLYTLYASSLLRHEMRTCLCWWRYLPVSPFPHCQPNCVSVSCSFISIDNQSGDIPNAQICQSHVTLSHEMQRYKTHAISHDGFECTNVCMRVCTVTTQITKLCESLDSMQYYQRVRALCLFI